MTTFEDRRSDPVDGFLARAQTLAESRGEAPNTAHLLVAVIEQQSEAAELLRGRTTMDSVLDLAATWRSPEQPLDWYRDRARELARSMRARAASDVHVLMALLNRKQCAARTALFKDEIDISRLRALCMNAGLGLVAKRAGDRTAEPTKSRGARRGAVTVPLMTRPIRPRTAKQLANQPDVRRRGDDGRPKKSSRRGSRFALDAKRHRLLSAIGVNLTLAAERGELSEVVGRHAEVEQVLDVLAKHRANNPCLVGMSGVGKTSVVHALAQRIARDDAALGGDERIIVEIPTSALLAGTGTRGALAQRIASLQKEVAVSGGRIVLFFDDIHELLGADATDELVTELKRALGGGRFSCIAATTSQSYSRLIENDTALQRRFARIEIDEPDLEVASEIVESTARALGERHGVEYGAESLAAAIGWSRRYLPGRALPDQALAIIDLAGSRCKRRKEATVTQQHVAQVVSERSKVPIERLLETDAERLLGLERAIAERIVGHERQIHEICRILRRNAAGFCGARPIGTFLLLGPTGVGKTETAKALSELLFGGEQALTRFDLSEYSEPHSVARLIGAPPGYVGFESGGQLTEAVRQRPYQVLLLDEVEKAHPEVLAAFLPLFDEGRLTDGHGRTIDFTNTVIFLTSNLGAEEAAPSSEGRLGFGNRAPRDHDVAARVKACAKKAFSPEFYNRLDETLVFEALSERHVEAIARILLQRLVDRVHERHGIEMEIESSVVRLLVQSGGFDRALGARPMRRTIARLVEAPLAEALLRGEFATRSVVHLTVTGGEVTIGERRVALD